MSIAKTNTYPIQVGSIGTVKECELINWRENRVMFTSYHDGKIYFFLIKTKKKKRTHHATTWSRCPRFINII